MEDVIVGKWRMSESSYHDVVRREFSGATRVIPREAALAAYRAEANCRLGKFVMEAMAPQFPERARELITVGRAQLASLQNAPCTVSDCHRMARNILAAWNKVVALPADDEAHLVAGLRDYVLNGKKINKRPIILARRRKLP